MIRMTPTILTAFLAVGIVLASLPCRAQFLLEQSTSKPGIVDRVNGTEIDWANECYYATGKGTLPPESEQPDRMSAYQSARADGKMKAVASLLIAINNTAVTFNTTGKDVLASDDTLQKLVDECATKADITGESQSIDNGDTVILVTIRIPMYGVKGVGSAVLKSSLLHQGREETAHAGLVMDKRPGGNTTTMSKGEHGPFTSLIVDCTGVSLQRAFNPKLRRLDGSEVAAAAQRQIPEDHGAITYARQMDEARRSSRAGSNPLVIRAAGRAGDRVMCDVIVSDDDNKRIAQENQTARFLDDFRIFFVVNGK